MTFRSGSLQARQERAGWVFLAPTVIVLAMVGLYPLVHTFWVSLTDAILAGAEEPRFVGLENYRKLFSDIRFREAATNTLVFATCSVSLEMFLGVVIALVMNAKFPGRGFVRAAILIPWALPTVVSSRIWEYMLIDTYGVINDLLVVKAGMFERRISFLSEPGWTMASVVAVDVWKTTPFVALMVLAGLQLIPPSLYEAASVDGASRRQQFWTITLPMLTPVLAVTLIFRVLDALRVFDVIWVLTSGQSGTESMATYTYRQTLGFRNLGYGSAASVAIFLLISACVALALTALRTRGTEETA